MNADTHNDSPWLAPHQTARYAPLSGDVAVDVVVVGGGITGVTAAYLLKKAGRRVALVERGRAGWGATGRSTSLITGVTELPLTTLVQRLGPARAQSVWDAGFAAISRMRATVRDERINCHFAWVPGFLQASDASAAAAEHMHRQAALAETLGIDARFIDAVPGLNRPGVLFPNQARLHPLRYLEVMLDRIHGHGSFVFEGSEVSAIDDSPCRVRVGRSWIRGEYLVLATHLPILREAWSPSDVSVRTSFAVRGTAPAGRLTEGLYWGHEDGAYEYFRVDRHAAHDEVILGGHEPVSRQRVGAGVSYRTLEAKLAARVPDVSVTHRWNGQIVLSHDGLPCIGEVGPGRFAATGFGSNGMTFGTLSGMMAADAALGRTNAWQTLFDIRRTIVGGDVWAAAGHAPRARQGVRQSRPGTQIDRAPIA